MTQKTKTPIALAFVREDNLPALAERITKINKQASKVGAEPVTVSPTGVEETRVTKVVKDASGQDRNITHQWVEVAVFGEQPKLAGGWTLLAVIDHREAIALVNTVPGVPVSPVGQRDRGPVCDHCNVTRRRSDTFVLLAEDGRIVQVGRQCLADFLGLSSNDPSRALLFFVGLGDVLSFEDDDEISFRAYGGAWQLEIASIVKLSGAIIDVNGFVSKSRSESLQQEATSSRVMDFIDPPQFSGRDAAAARAEFQAWVSKVEAKMTPALDAEVTAAIQWAASQTGDSDFIQNVASLAQLTSVGRKYLGTVVWIMAGYRKDQQRLQEAQSKARLFGNSQHFGTEKQRMEAELTLVDVRAIDGHYGTSYLTTFVTSDGNKAKWFASNDPTDAQYSSFEGGWEVGQTRNVKFTVKSHGDWQGTLETGITRVAAPKAPKAKKKAKSDKVLRAEILAVLSERPTTAPQIEYQIEGLGDRRLARLLEALQSEGLVQRSEFAETATYRNPNTLQWSLIA
jgi:hypothetical protein